MRRPRHREKSNLLWKMLGVAGVVNLVLWPVLIHEGVFPGIRREVLMPVRLVSVPPSQKPPDALQKVARASTGASGTATTVTSAPHRRRTRPKPPVPPVAAAPKAAAPHRPRTAPPVAAKKPARTSSPTPPPVAKQTPAAPRRAEPHPKHVAQAKRVTPVNHPVRAVPREAAANTAHAVHPALPSRVIRAKQLEAQEHQAAQRLAQQRAARMATLPPRVAPPPPVASETPSAPPNTNDVEPDSPKTPDNPKINVVTPSETEAAGSAPTPKAAPPASAQFVPAVVICKAHPTIPDFMMRSAWHATFRGRFTIRPDGTATVQMVSSTGSPILDRRAIEAARRWRFRPARQNGTPVTSSQTFAFEYDVHPVR